MIKYVKLFLKGFVIGISNLIPGLGGGTVALLLGIYEQFLSALGHLFSDFKKNVSFLAPIILGMVCSLISLSGVISYCLTNFLFITILFFCGAILGGIPKIFESIKDSKINLGNLLSFVSAFLLVTLPLFFADKTIAFTGNMSLLLFIKLILLGMTASATMIIPGVSGSAVLMALGGCTKNSAKQH